MLLKDTNVVIGEMGSVNKNNTQTRNEWAKYYIRNARKFHMSCILWDNRDFDNKKRSSRSLRLFPQR